MGFLSGFKRGLAVCAIADIAANDGGRSRGDDEIVVVTRDRIIVVRGSTAKDEGRAMLGFESRNVPVPVVEAVVKLWAFVESNISSEADDRFEDE
jgi:hypothetical protein